MFKEQYKGTVEILFYEFCRNGLDGTQRGLRGGDGCIPKHRLVMALFSLLYSGDGSVPQKGQGPGQLSRSEVPLPFYFAFPLFPSLYLPAATIPCGGHEGTSTGLFTHSTKQLAPPWHRVPVGRGKLGARCNHCSLHGPTGGTGLRRGTGVGSCCALLSPGLTFLFFTIICTLCLYILDMLTVLILILIYCLYS